MEIKNFEGKKSLFDNEIIDLRTPSTNEQVEDFVNISISKENYDKLNELYVVMKSIFEPNQPSEGSYQTHSHENLYGKPIRISAIYYVCTKLKQCKKMTMKQIIDYLETVKPGMSADGIRNLISTRLVFTKILTEDKVRYIILNDRLTEDIDKIIKKGTESINHNERLIKRGQQ